MGSGSGTGGSGLMGGADGVDENGNRDGDGEDDDGLDISISTMKRYISYCRTRCAPTLSEEATLMLRSHYVSIRNDQRQRSMQEGASNAAVVVVFRITVPTIVRAQSIVAETEAPTFAALLASRETSRDATLPA